MSDHGPGEGAPPIDPPDETARACDDRTARAHG